ncbi:unnamed protein product (macronuclear) [Paramecium tetraurelia]|uniref:Transmembrane protein n=1 Tax=Paramecium tetraurelia TaxID=5888 RepID=A0DLG9_PARTE|nr:uncharacterized protein GSPATT00018203001 [Paramecium tetraurelia]CAK83886.1 unnamed protein product [Paramecium tetraurelia]|eukprot:XP_001451283.1 hypothetical protein (macronuclear) [Paramecium tetraurelia strain d4-2]
MGLVYWLQQFLILLTEECTILIHIFMLKLLILKDTKGKFDLEQCLFYQNLERIGLGLLAIGAADTIQLFIQKLDFEKYLKYFQEIEQEQNQSGLESLCQQRRNKIS